MGSMLYGMANDAYTAISPLIYGSSGMRDLQGNGVNSTEFQAAAMGTLLMFTPAGEEAGALNATKRAQIEALRSGKDVFVKSVDEARLLLRNMPELRPHVSNLPSNSGELFHGTEFGGLWQQPRGTYRGDLINTRDISSDVIHSSGNKLHDTNPHYNILFHDGNKGAIIINH